MAVSFFGGPDGAGTRVWSVGKFVSEEQDKEKLRARIRELESLCTDVLVAGVDIGLPQPLLNQLWAAVGSGELPQAYQVDLPTAASRATDTKKEAVAAPSIPQSGPDPAKRPPLEIPDFPLTNNPNAPTADIRPRHSQPELKPFAVKKTVAVVDDDPMMLDLLQRILQRENFELMMAGGGPEMLERLSAYDGQIDLLVTDYAMPEMQGRELAEKLRDRFPALKVLYQTGFSDMLFENRVELEDGAAFVEKPFTARGLREAARLMLFGSINP
jgi:CheY-like chemotaxis protein